MDIEPMEPRMTVQNMTGKKWHVTLEHEFSEFESVRITVMLPKGQVSIGDIEDAVIVRVKELLNRKFDKP